jgi:hypothetical protein
VAQPSAEPSTVSLVKYSLAFRSIMPWQLLVSGLASVALVGVGVAVGTPFGWWLAGCAASGWVLAAGFVLVSRRTARHEQAFAPQAQRLTGRTVRQAQPLVASAPNGWRWVGGGIMPASMGRVNATWPLAVLEVTSGELSLRLRPRILAVMFGARRLHASTAENTLAFPARGWFGSKGIGIQVDNQRPYYFLRADQAGLLSALAAAGFAVTWDEQRIRYL